MIQLSLQFSYASCKDSKISSWSSLRSSPCNSGRPSSTSADSSGSVLMGLVGSSSNCSMSLLETSNRFTSSSKKFSSIPIKKDLLDLRRTTSVDISKCSPKQVGRPLRHSRAVEKKEVQKGGKKEHHLWKKRDSAGSGQKALNLIRIISELPNEKEAVYGALNKWIAWETEFPLLAAAKALLILRKRRQWRRVIQVAKWMLSKGQGTTMATYDTLLLAFDMDQRVDEAESLWNMILHTHTRSVSKRLFSRMISLYDHHHALHNIIEVFADMEELGVKPDEDTLRRVARAFKKLGEEDKQKLVLKRYGSKWKYLHFNGERVRVRRDWLDEE